MVSDRGLDVLRAIVQDYVAMREPVGSKSIVERHAFGVSPATDRPKASSASAAAVISARCADAILVASVSAAKSSGVRGTNGISFLTACSGHHLTTPMAAGLRRRARCS